MIVQRMPPALLSFSLLLLILAPTLYACAILLCTAECGGQAAGCMDERVTPPTGRVAKPRIRLDRPGDDRVAEPCEHDILVGRLALFLKSIPDAGGLAAP